MASVAYEQGQAESHRYDFGTSVWICYGKCHYVFHICEVRTFEKAKYFRVLVGRGFMAIIFGAFQRDFNGNQQKSVTGMLFCCKTHWIYSSEIAKLKCLPIGILIVFAFRREMLYSAPEAEELNFQTYTYGHALM
jgi:hypothetical protein